MRLGRALLRASPVAASQLDAGAARRASAVDLELVLLADATSSIDDVEIAAAAPGLRRGDGDPQVL